MVPVINAPQKPVTYLKDLTTECGTGYFCREDHEHQVLMLTTERFDIGGLLTCVDLETRDVVMIGGSLRVHPLYIDTNPVFSFDKE